MSLVKRTVDIAGASILLFSLSPLMALIAIRVKLDRDGPVMYSGVRVGQGGREFAMHKFRSMIVDAEKTGSSITASSDQRITHTGRILRRYKLDELPQLLNVLKGEMSLVGPRPEVPSQVAKWSGDERRLLTVRPGITDWASLRFYDEGAMLDAYGDADGAYEELLRPEKMRLAVEYVNHHTLRIDFAILTITACLPFWRVIKDVRLRVCSLSRGRGA